MKEIPLNTANVRSWKHTDQPDRIQPHAKRYDERKRSHTKPESFDDLPEEIKKGFRSIRNYIHSIDPDAKVYAWGSRVEGIYLEGSDWDVMVKTKFDLEVYNFDPENRFMKVHAIKTTKKTKYLIDG